MHKVGRLEILKDGTAETPRASAELEWVDTRQPGRMGTKARFGGHVTKVDLVTARCELPTKRTATALGTQ